MSYMIEGGGSTTHSKSKKWLYAYPEASQQLLQLIADVLVDHLVAQICAGAQVRFCSTSLNDTYPAARGYKHLIWVYHH